MPRIHVTTKHYDIVLEVRAWNLGHRVVAHQVIVLETYRKIDGHFYRFTGLKHPNDAIVLLDRKHKLGCHFGRTFIVDRCSTAKRRRRCVWVSWRSWYGSRLDEDRSAIAATRIDEQRSVLLLEESEFGIDEVECCSVSAAKVTSVVPTRPRFRCVREGEQSFFIESLSLCVEVSRNFPHRRGKNDLPIELALVLLEVGFGFGIDVNNVGRNRFRQTRRPGLGIRNQGYRLRLDDLS